MANIPSYMLIRQYVIDLFFRHTDPMQPLPSEHELAHKFGVSRTTIRSALEDLIRNGYLIRRNRSGMYLSPEYVIPTSGHYKKVLLLVGDGKYAFYEGKMLRIISKVCNYFSTREYRLVPVNLSTNSSPAEELMFYRPDGILWIQPEPDLSGELKNCAKKIPLQILFGYDISMPNSSCVDYAHGAEILASFFEEAGVSGPYLIGAGKTPIRLPFTKKWKKRFGQSRVLPIMQSGRKNLEERFQKSPPDGIFCFESEIHELKAALPNLPEHTVTDFKTSGIPYILDLSPAEEILYACRALEKRITAPALAEPCRIIRPELQQ